jgi:hypothetical protein
MVMLVVLGLDIADDDTADRGAALPGRGITRNRRRCSLGRPQRVLLGRSRAGPAEDAGDRG